MKENGTRFRSLFSVFGLRLFVQQDPDLDGFLRLVRGYVTDLVPVGVQPVVAEQEGLRIVCPPVVKTLAAAAPDAVARP